MIINHIPLQILIDSFDFVLKYEHIYIIACTEIISGSFSCFHKLQMCVFSCVVSWAVSVRLTVEQESCSFTFHENASSP